ncbi:phage tail protein [Escherichia coli]|uniref:phage tail fiber protein n=1 Tax=Escherichia coli TaxID=562 RepID=UPI001918EFE6|nr:phage tail protein [Escherichia coli]MDL4641067.1 phage tail protein [Escherichia coli]MEC5666429.1 phage tail protein [Escherichia coli]MEC5707736.1 phage tail protein [Escherichia coli]
MSAGTLTLTNNSDIVTGIGTSFATELDAGDFVVVTVGGVPYTLPVKSVESDTDLTLVSNFTGPTQSGAAWSAVPRVALNMVTAALVAQSAEALRGLNYDKQNWQQVFSAAGNITVKLPDGTTFTGPSWKYLSDNMATKSGGAVPVNQGGTGSTSASGARTNLGLGSSATRDAYSTSGSMLAVGDFGVGSDGMNRIHQDARVGAGFYRTLMSLGGIGDNVSLIEVPYDANTMYQLIIPTILATNPKLYLRTLCSTATYNGQIVEFYSTGNTTKASDGTLKVASPVVKIFSDGSFHLNDESAGCTVTRINTGAYLIEGCMGLNADAAWGGIDGGFDIPTDRNKQPLIWLDYEVNADGSILVRTYHRTYPTAPVFARNERDGIEEGEPVDIPADQFVSVRVEMPADSVYSRSLHERGNES